MYMPATGLWRCRAGPSGDLQTGVYVLITHSTLPTPTMVRGPLSTILPVSVP